MKKIAMQPNNNQILDTTNKASEFILRTTVVELLEDAIALAKQGATSDQLLAFLRGVSVTLEAARSLAMAHTGEEVPMGGAIGLTGRLGAVNLRNLPTPQEHYLEEIDKAYQDVVESYNEDVAAWEKEQSHLTETIENLQAEIAQLSAPKNGHRTLVEEEYEGDDEDEEEELISTPKRSVRRGTSSRERVREMLSGRRIGGGRGFGRGR